MQRHANPLGQVYYCYVLMLSTSLSDLITLPGPSLPHADISNQNTTGKCPTSGVCTRPVRNTATRSVCFSLKMNDEMASA